MTTSNQDAFAKYVEQQEQEQKHQVREALRNLDAAHREIANVRKQLLEAAAGNPYLRIGRIQGVDAGIVFQAFGTVERVATLKQMEV